MVKAYHFVGATLRDGRPIPADGEWLVHDGDVNICESGLHASRHPLDALQHAPGSTLCLVECEDIVTEHDDKFVCRRRKIVKRIDATDLLWSASRKFALSVIHLWDAPAVVREYLETGDEAKRDAAWGAARDAACAAAESAVRDAKDAARDAAWGAARGAARDPAFDAARDAACAAARDAAWAAAWDDRRETFGLMVKEAFNG